MMETITFSYVVASLERIPGSQHWRVTVEVQGDAAFSADPAYARKNNAGGQYVVSVLGGGIDWSTEIVAGPKSRLGRWLATEAAVVAVDDAARQGIEAQWLTRRLA